MKCIENILYLSFSTESNQKIVLKNCCIFGASVPVIIWPRKAKNIVIFYNCIFRMSDIQVISA